MPTDSKTQRRWIVSVLEAVADTPGPRIQVTANRHASQTPMQRGQKGIAMRLTPATRAVSDAAR